MVYASITADTVANFGGRTHVLFCLSIVIISVQRKRNCLLDQSTDTEVNRRQGHCTFKSIHLLCVLSVVRSLEAGVVASRENDYSLSDLVVPGR